MEEAWSSPGSPPQKDKQENFRLPQCQQKDSEKGQKGLEDNGFDYKATPERKMHDQ